MSAAMDNLLKMFNAAREAAGESLDIAMTATDVEALPVCSSILRVEDDDDRYID